MPGRDAWLLGAYAVLTFALNLPETNLTLFAAHGGFDAEFFQAISGVAGLPWCIKPVVGAFADATPLLGRTRAPYMQLGALAFAVAWLCLPLTLHSKPLFAALLFAQSFAAMVVDVMLDGVLVTRCHDTEAGDGIGVLQANCWVVRAVAAFASSVLGGVCATAPVGRVCTATGLVFLLVFVAADRIEPWGTPLAAAPAGGVKGVLLRTRDVMLCTPSLRGVAAMLALVCLCPSANVVFSYFLTNELSYSGFEFTVIDVCGHVASLCGALAFKHCLRRARFRTIFAACICVIFVLRAAQLLLALRVSSSVWLAASDEAALAIVSSVLVMPALVVAARASDRDSSAVYGAVLSLANLASIVGVELGAGAALSLGVGRANYSHLPVLLAVLSFVGLAPLCALPLLPRGLSAVTADASPAQSPRSPPALRAPRSPPARAGAPAAPGRRRPASAPPAVGAAPPAAQSSRGTAGTCPPSEATCGHICSASGRRSTASAETAAAPPAPAPHSPCRSRTRLSWRRIAAAARRTRGTRPATSSARRDVVVPVLLPQGCDAV